MAVKSIIIIIMQCKHVVDVAANVCGFTWWKHEEEFEEKTMWSIVFDYYVLFNA